jgi:phosphoenolpyruvate-protein kinase (PTS system EI component)
MHLAPFFHVGLSSDAGPKPVGRGHAASPGAATGAIVLTAEDAVAAADLGRSVILVRRETTPNDVLGVRASAGVLTTRGGITSHAAVVARGWGIPAVVGATGVEISGDEVAIGEMRMRAGQVVTIDGNSGEIYAEPLRTARVEPPPELDVLLRWADAVNDGHVEVRVNADVAADATNGRRFGAQGIGLCRTEHMFLSAERMPLMRRFIMASDDDKERAALSALEASQEEDFTALLQATGSHPVRIRLLDLPLHEFLADILDLTAREARGELYEEEALELAKVRTLHETNPMLGTRGVRLDAVRPGLYKMQVRAMCSAAVKLYDRGLHPQIEIMIPFVVDAGEVRIVRSWVDEVLDEIAHPELGSIVKVGAMIETPRAAITAAALAEHADFFSFGTNDLTQMVYAFSRDDVEGRLLPAYESLGVLHANPFEVLDEVGVGEMMRLACEQARRTKPTISLGACGEHAGHPESAASLVRMGLDSVSCSPFRLPMARLGVAQALVECGRVDVDEVPFEFDLAIDDGRETGSRTARCDDDPPKIDEASVLHTLRVRGLLTPDGFRASLGFHPAEILASLVEAGHVRYVADRDMYSLLPSGRARHEEELNGQAGNDLRLDLAQGYEEFLRLNADVKQVCTDWQMRGEFDPNDHHDPVYDSACIERLCDLSASAGSVIDRLARVLPRLARYRRRLEDAAAAVADGDGERFTGVMCESFHDVWMELHEDLIVLQRIDRSDEGSF